MNYPVNPERFLKPALEPIAAAGVLCLYDMSKSTPYLHYPDATARLPSTQLDETSGTLVLPEGGWWVRPEDNQTLTTEQVSLLRASGVMNFDSANRPLHPWLQEMRTLDDFGLALGRGAYWNWGPNRTADPIVVRYDQAEPQVLLIQRNDTKAWALPGGFIDSAESGIHAAARETLEETGIDISACLDTARVTYRGPVADVRTTLHAWPETTAVRIDLTHERAATLPLGCWEGGDDAGLAAWVALSNIPRQLFGSHRLLIAQALDIEHGA